jgi:hypothetical protein
MTKITYLIGAGASANAIPIVSKMREKLIEFINVLQSPNSNISNEEVFTNAELQRRGIKPSEMKTELLELLQWMASNMERHVSVDTFAKKLYLTGKDTEFNNLKIALSIFLTYVQAINRPDQRYDAFYASILNDHYTNFPDNVRIVSWNYDYQFELSFNTFSNSKEFLDNQKILRIIEKNSKRKTQNKFEIYKINGTCGFFTNHNFTNSAFINSISKPELTTDQLMELLSNYAVIRHVKKYPLSLSFAWEEIRFEDDVIKDAISNVNDTQALVVIGYSFPYYNREIDRKIIGSMTNLKKVYIQDLGPKTIKERFKAIRDDIDDSQFVLNDDKNLFLIPNEL